jgi:hypothetical protein
MKQVGILLICLMLISVVRGMDFTCQAGYGSLLPFTSGDASQCSGVSKITTEAECRAAAEYNSKNNIDKNTRYVRTSYTAQPPGCTHLLSTGVYTFYISSHPSTYQCSDRARCICKPKTCIKCPINTYSEGGINPTCIPCPKDRPYTAEGATIFDSADVCAKEKNTFYCEAGTEYKNNNIIEMDPIPRTSGECMNKITTAEECEATAEYNRKNNIHNNKGYVGPLQGSAIYDPPGCLYHDGKISPNLVPRLKDKYRFTANSKSTRTCYKQRKCICQTKEICVKCPRNTYSAGGAGPSATCKKCIAPFITDKERTNCYNPEIEKELAKFKKQLVAQKEKQNDLSIKNSRLWQKEHIRLQHDKLMKERKSNDDKNEQKSCERQRSKGTVIFPAIEISNEIEKIEDTTCIDTNRDELLKSFCSFTSDLDNLFQIQNIDKEAKIFWPNICCKERRDATLEVCEDPTGNIKRENIIPFALSQGGDYSRHNLYVEVTEAIKYNGYLHKGMTDLLRFLQPSIKNPKISYWSGKVNQRFEYGQWKSDPDRSSGATIPKLDYCKKWWPQTTSVLDTGMKETIKFCGAHGDATKCPYTSEKPVYECVDGNKGKSEQLVNSFFDDVSLCGPRIVDAPGNPENKLCELFVPYKHAMRNFYSLVESLFMQPMKILTSSFLETMERSLRKRSAAKRVGKNNIQNMMQMKPMPKVVETKCTGGSQWVSSKLKKKKQDFCLGYNHLDLSDTNIKNVAVHYLKNDISYNDKKMFELSKQLRYQVTDTSCPSPLFTAGDISIQRVAMDVLGKEKEWVAVINLNTQDKNGYLQSELPYCNDRPYLIGAEIMVKAYEDTGNYCGKLLDYDKCKSRCIEECQYEKNKQLTLECENSCDNKMIKLKDKHHKHYSKDVVLTGTQYTVDDSHVSRRRRLLQNQDSGC